MIKDLKQVREALGQMELDLSYYVHLATKAKTKNKWIDVEIYKVEMSIDSIRKQIATLDRLIAEQDAAPDGYKLVPVDPTVEMINAGVMVDKKAWETANEFYDRTKSSVAHVHNINRCTDAYKAMLSAAPEVKE